MKKIFVLLAPSTVAASYKSSGMFIKIPDTINIVYGIPTHMLMIIIIAFARTGLFPETSNPKNGIDSVIQPKSFNIVLTGPLELNKKRTDNNEINVGKSLLIPIKTAIGQYKVIKGDTLYSIANKFNTSVELLYALNNLTSSYIFPNQTLLVPK